jgi:hypothetical protein
MDTTANGILAVNTLRLAHDFMAAFTLDPSAAIAHLRITLDGMEEKEVSQWLDYLGQLLVEEESTPDVWYAMFKALESIETTI